MMLKISERNEFHNLAYYRRANVFILFIFVEFTIFRITLLKNNLQ